MREATMRPRNPAVPEELFEAVVRGEQAAFRELFASRQPALRRNAELFLPRPAARRVTGATAAEVYTRLKKRELERARGLSPFLARVQNHRLLAAVRRIAPELLTPDDFAKARTEMLVLAAMAGNEAAFAALVGRYFGNVFAMALRLVRDRQSAEDIAQLTFLEVHKALMTRSLGDFRGFKSYLLRTCLSKVLKLVKLRRSQPGVVSLEAVLAHGEADFRSSELSVEEEFERRELARLLQEIVERHGRDPEIRLAVLRHVEGLSQEQIKQRGGIPLGTVKVRIHRGLAKLRRLLTDAGVELPSASSGRQKPGHRGEALEK